MKILKFIIPVKLFFLNSNIPIALTFIALSTSIFGQQQSPQEYVEKWKDEAIRQMHKYKIPASITLAQGILESGSGNSRLATKGNNHFGVKCHDWNGAKIYQDDDAKNECFRKYKNASHSFEDHSIFLTSRSRYNSLFDLKTTDYKGWAKGLKKAGYATNPKYPSLLIGLIEKYDLAQYDKVKDSPPIVKNDEVENDVDPDEKVTKKKAKEPQQETITIGGNHKISIHENRIRYIVIKKGDTFTKLCKEFDMRLWQFYKYNDIDENHTLKIGEVIFLQPKKGKAKEEYHIVKKGETLHSISQKYGIKLKKLCQKNNLATTDEIQQDQKLFLKKKKK